MKANFYPFFLLLAGLLFASCKKDKLAYDNQFDRSYRTFKDFKASSGNSYRFTVASGSWTGSGSETTITVRNGKTVERSFVAKRIIDYTNNTVDIYEQWTEDEASLNTHDNGFKLLTLDEVYQKAKTDWLLKRKDADTYFEAKNSGMISSCGYVPHGCADDCFWGVTITLIEKL
jgi:hypothetical protein